MTRSGFNDAAALAMAAKGQARGSLQAWVTLPLMRHPVSPNTMMRWGSVDGTGSARPSTDRVCVPGGMGRLQVSGNLGSAGARTVIGNALPLMSTDGHAEAP